MSTDSAAAPVLPGRVQPAPAGVKGFDIDTPLTPDLARDFYAKGYRFVVRYVGRLEMASIDLTTREAEDILASGLALMVVQHVMKGTWIPSQAMGEQYGQNAATFTRQIGVPPGVTVWCDLESVDGSATADEVMAYCNAWHDQVAQAGYVPGLYVGYQPGMSGRQLYQSLKFGAYWAAYNVDGVSTPSPRGWQLVQKVASGGSVGGLPSNSYDDDLTQADGMGSTPAWLAPA